jgi:hypothetical protein
MVRPDEVVGLASYLEEIWGGTPLAFAKIVGWWLVQARKTGRIYIPDPEGPLDFWCSPKSTARRGGGDCDALAVLIDVNYFCWPTTTILAGAACGGCRPRRPREGRKRRVDRSRARDHFALALVGLSVPAAFSVLALSDRKLGPVNSKITE